MVVDHQLQSVQLADENPKMSSHILMYLKYLLSFICLWGIVNCHPSPSKDTPLSAVVDLGYSKYEGTVLEAGVNQYLGMRYAAPPVRGLRWRAPHDPRSNASVQDATQVG